VNTVGDPVDHTAQNPENAARRPHEGPLRSFPADGLLWDIEQPIRSQNPEPESAREDVVWRTGEMEDAILTGGRASVDSPHIGATAASLCDYQSAGHDRVVSAPLGHSLN
jgi:hypothetical protein